MGLFIQQKDNRSQLQERLATELRERAKMQANGAEPLDQTKDSNYLKNTEMATGRSWLWLALAVVIIVAIICLSSWSYGRRHSIFLYSTAILKIHYD